MNPWRHAQYGEMEQLQQALAEGYRINVLNKYHQSLLYVASEHNRCDVVDMLLRRGAGVNIGAKPLIAASRTGCSVCVKRLLDAGANVNASNTSGLTALEAALSYRNHGIVKMLIRYGAVPENPDRVLALLSFRDDHEIATLLLERGLCSRQWTESKLKWAFLLGMKDLAQNMMSNSKSNTTGHQSFMLYHSANNKWLDFIVHILDKGADINGSTEAKTALIGACEAGNAEIAQFLLKQGAHANGSDRQMHPLESAITNGDPELVQLLLEHGADFAIAEKRAGKSMLHLAFDGGATGVVELLVKHGLNIDSTDSKGNTILQKAAKSHKLAELEKILSMGADVNHLNKSHETALHFVCDHIANTISTPSLNEACATENEEISFTIADILLSNGANSNVTSSAGETPLYKACEKGLSKVVQRLLTAGSDTNLQRFNKYPLITACANGFEHVAELLLTAGADINLVPCVQNAFIRKYLPEIESKLHDCTTPLSTAVEHCRHDMVKFLISRGANVNLPDAFSRRAIDYAVDGLASKYVPSAEILHTRRENDMLMSAEPEMFDDTSLFKACNNGHYDIVKDLLEHGACPNQIPGISNCSYPIVIACQKNDARLVALLLEHGSKLHSVVHRRNTALGTRVKRPDEETSLLHVASANSNKVIVETLIKAGADLNVVDSAGNTPLHVTIAIDVAELLIRFGISLESENNEGNTPIICACLRDLSDMVKLLLSAGADPNHFNNKSGKASTSDNNKSHTTVTKITHESNSGNVESTTCALYKVYPLCVASQKRNESIVQMLLEHGAHTEVCDNSKNTPLHYAVTPNEIEKQRKDKQCNNQIVELLLKHGASPNVVNDCGKTPLCIAIVNNLYDTIEKLCQYDANPNLATSRTYPLVLASENGLHSIVELLLARKADADVVSAYSSLCIAIKNKDRRLIDILINHSANVNVCDVLSQYPLHHAINHYVKRSGDLDLLKLLLSHGASTNVANIEGMTPLSLACRFDDHEFPVIKLLLDNGADPNFTSSDTESKNLTDQCNKTTWSSHSASIDYPLSHAVMRRNAPLVSLLLENGAKPNNTNYDGQTALHLATKYEDYTPDGSPSETGTEQSIVDILLRAGASVNAVDHGGKTPLYIACRKNMQSTVWKLLQHKADPNLTTADAGKYPLLAACRPKLDCEAVSIQHHLVARELLKAGANPNIMTSDGRSILSIACENNDWEMVKILLVGGADPNFSSGSCEFPTFPIFLAMDKSNVEIVELLFTHGQRVDVSNKDGETVLQCAVKRMLSIGKSSNYFEIAMQLAGNVSSSLQRKFYSIEETMKIIKVITRAHCEAESGDNCTATCSASLDETVAFLMGSEPTSKEHISAVLEMATSLIACGASMKLSRNTEVNHREKTENNGIWNLTDFFIPPNRHHSSIMMAFKAGAGLTLLSIICKAARAITTVSDNDMSVRLCQAIILDGYRVCKGELDKLRRITGDSRTKLISWLEEDLKSPPSLLRQARIAVRKELRQMSDHRSLLRYIDSMQIPDDFKRCLKYDDEILFSQVDLSLPTADVIEDPLKSPCTGQSYYTYDSGDYNSLFNVFNNYGSGNVGRRCRCGK